MDGTRAYPSLSTLGHIWARFCASRIAGRRLLVATLALRTMARDQRNATTMSARRSGILLTVIMLTAIASVLFGLRSYGSFLLLRSA